jgi:N-acetylneuraminic acid mutarotase
MNYQRATTVVKHLACVGSILCLVFLGVQVIPHAFGRETKNKEASAGGDPPSNCVWTSAATFPIPIMDEAVVTLGSNIYTFGGISEGKGVPNAYKFDGSTWTPIAPYPSACGVESASAVTDGTFIYIMNGSTFCPLMYSTDVYRYDPQTDTYTQLASTSVGTWTQTAVYLNGKIYKMGGKNATDYQTALEIYDIVTDTWSFGTPLPEPTGFASSWTQDGLILVAGGVVASGVATNAIYAYDPVLQVWFSVCCDLPDTRWGAAATVYGDTILMAGGLVGGVDFVNVSASAIYAGGNGWVALPDMLEKRARMNGAVLNGSFYVIGGFSSEADFLIGTTSNQKLTCQFGATPTPTPTATPTARPTASPTATPTSTPTPAATPRATARPRPTSRPRPTPQ